ncbi:hypothetical protein AX16_005647 [Volvariella volvacea WC 439]|nr:hypothetical protein AX16_005647 [Volvariella volvacea WC 439]
MAELDWDSRPLPHSSRDWHERPSAAQSPPMNSPPASYLNTSSSLSQRRRSSAAHVRPAGPPPNHPIPSVPQAALSQPHPVGIPFEDTQGSPQFSHYTPAQALPITRPGASPNLAAVAAFSQSRQATSSSNPSPIPSAATSVDDLSDPPPQSVLVLTSRPHERPPDRDPPQDRLAPPERREPRPSSRRALTRALELAREAVQLDSMNDNPEAAVQAYGRSVALLSEVMERVRRGEDSTDGHRRRRRRSLAAQEEEVRRLQTIHDTYADRMNILSIIYSIPIVPYSSSSLYSSVAASTDSAQSASPTTSASPISETFEQIPQHIYTQPSSLSGSRDGHYSPDLVASDTDHLEDPMSALLDSSNARGSAPSDSGPLQHPYAIQYDSSPSPIQPIVAPTPVISAPSPPNASSQPSPHRASIIRRPRATSNLPPPAPPPTNSPPPAPYPIVVEPSVPASIPAVKRLEVPDTRPRGNSVGHRRTGSGSGRLTALEEEETERLEEDNEKAQPGSNNHSIDGHHHLVPDTPRTARRESPPLPPLPSPPSQPTLFRNHSTSPATKVPSPKLTNVIAPRPRGSSTLTTRSDFANHGAIINSTTTQGTIFQRRTKTSAPPTPRSSSPTDSTISFGSVPLKAPSTSLPSSTTPGAIPHSRSRSNSQPGRRPTLVNGHVSPLDQRPPVPANAAVATRKPSLPSKLNPNVLPPLTIQTDMLSGPGGLIPPPPTLSNTLPTTPTSPLPPAPPNDPIRRPYHMMLLLKNTMESATGGYVTRRLHVPREVWSQGGAKLTNVADKVRVVNILCGALEDLQHASADAFGAGNVSSGMVLGIGSIGRKEGDAWISKLEEFASVCDGIASNFGKKLGVGEGFALKKFTWGDKLSRRFDKLTTAKNLDSPDTYVQGLKRLFLNVQLLDEHSRAMFSQPMAPVYNALPLDIRAAAEAKLRHSSEFFSRIVLTFIIRDLMLLLDKYAKKCEKWLAE